MAAFSRSRRKIAKTKSSFILRLVLACVILLIISVAIFLIQQVVQLNETGLISNQFAVTHKSHRNLPRILAFVFPQFHADSINDQLWGPGFTDWDSLRAAPSKNRLGHPIPRPTELGYYNYTDLEPRRRQGQLARQYGIDGFIFHHYWFYDPDHPGPNLHQPLVNMLKDGEPDIPFALHWCASKWVSTWNGKVRPDFHFKEPGVLQKQYFPSNPDDPLVLEHYQWLRQFFKHKNYIKVDGRPLFMLYQRKPGSFPVIQKFRELAKQDGFPDLYLAVGLTKPHPHLMDIGNIGQYDNKPQVDNEVSKRHFDRVVDYPNPTDWNVNRTFELPEFCKSHSKVSPLRDIPGIVAAFDNTPRRDFDTANVWSTPDTAVQNFRKNLQVALYYEY